MDGQMEQWQRKGVLESFTVTFYMPQRLQRAQLVLLPLLHEVCVCVCIWPYCNYRSHSDNTADLTYLIQTLNKVRKTPVTRLSPSPTPIH